MIVAADPVNLIIKEKNIIIIEKKQYPPQEKLTAGQNTKGEK